jgi:hypothetical protein
MELSEDFKDLMDVFKLIPENFDRIIEATADHEHPYTLELLQQKYSEAKSMDKAAFIMVMKPRWYERSFFEIKTNPDPWESEEEL